MSTPDPIAAATLAELQRDNAQDAEQTTKIIDGLAHRNALAQVAIQAADKRADKLVDVLEDGPRISRREAAVYILANLSASTSAATARRVLIDRLAILEDLAP